MLADNLMAQRRSAGSRQPGERHPRCPRGNRPRIRNRDGSDRLLNASFAGSMSEFLDDLEVRIADQRIVQRNSTAGFNVLRPALMVANPVDADGEDLGDVGRVMPPSPSDLRLRGARRKCGSNPMLGSNSAPLGLPTARVARRWRSCKRLDLSKPAVSAPGAGSRRHALGSDGPSSANETIDSLEEHVRLLDERVGVAHLVDQPETGIGQSPRPGRLALQGQR